MKNVKITTRDNSTNGSYELDINGRIFNSTKKNFFNVPLSSVRKINVNQFPIDVTIVPSYFKNGREVDLPLMPRFKNIDGKKASVELNHCPEIFLATAESKGYALYQETMVDMLLLNTQLNPKILLNGFDARYFHLHYSIELDSNSVEKLYEAAGKFHLTQSKLVKAEVEKMQGIVRKALNLSVQPSQQSQLIGLMKAS
jgi:hypothetical protein